MGFDLRLDRRDRASTVSSSFDQVLPLSSFISFAVCVCEEPCPNENTRIRLRSHTRTRVVSCRHGYFALKWRVHVTQSATNRPQQVIGMHFMNPPPIMKLIEIVRGADTSDETFSSTKALAERFGKTVICSRDYPGFIVNRILMPMINEAFYALYTGVATKEDIDTGMRLGTNHPMGPLTLADFIGLDVCLSIMKILHAGLGDSRYAPCPLLVQYVDAGHLGRKRGIGVYDYRKVAEKTGPSARL